MLDTLRSIVQDVNSAPTFRHALDVIVARVREAMGTEVCSIYLVDPARDRFLFVATEGSEQGRCRTPVSRTRPGTGRAGRHPRRTAQSRRRDAPSELPLSARDRRRAVPLVPRRADHPAAPRARRAGGAAARPAAVSTKARKRFSSRCRRSSPASSRTPKRPAISRTSATVRRSCRIRASSACPARPASVSAPRWSFIRPRSSKACRIAKPTTSPSN